MKRRHPIIAWSCCILLAGHLAGQSQDMFSVVSYGSIQEAIDRNPERMLFVPAGDHIVAQTIRLASANSGLWGPGRIIQTNADAAILEIDGTSNVQLRDITLTRAEGKMETTKAGIHVTKSAGVRLLNVRVLNNWGNVASVLVENCEAFQIRGCLIQNYSRVAVDDRIGTEMLDSGFAFNAIDGHGLVVREAPGAMIQDNRIIELRMIPTPELKAKYRLGHFIRKTRKGAHIPQHVWDAEYVNNWHQGSALQVTGPEVSDYVHITGNYIENAAQGIDVHADHVIVAQNIVNNAFMGVKTNHGARNVIIMGNQFSKNDLWGINMVPSSHSHLAEAATDDRPAAGTRRLISTSKHFPVRYADANIDGYSIIAKNIISDFGYGHARWIWSAPDSGVRPAPIRLAGTRGFVRPPIRDVLVQGNLIHDTGRDQILKDGVPQVEPPRYDFAVSIMKGEAAPRGLHFADNVFHSGTKGVADADLRPEN